MAKITFEFDDSDPDDRDTVRKIVHLDDVYSDMNEAYSLVRNRRKYSENIDDEQYSFLTDVMKLMQTDE